MLKKLRCLQAISRAQIDDARRFLLAEVVNLYVELDEAQAERFAAETRKDEEVRKMVITWEETLADREARGEARGLLKAMRNSILRVLQRRLRQRCRRCRVEPGGLPCPI